MTGAHLNPPHAGTADLTRGLRRLDLTALTFNLVIGAGIFTMPAAIAAGAGNWSLLLLLAAILLVALIALCMAEVASRFDVTGGPVIYAGEAFGPLAGFAVGWLMYIAKLSGFSAVAVIMLDYGAGLWPVLEIPVVRAATVTLYICALAAINLRGAVSGALTSNILTLVKITPLVALALGGVFLTQGSASQSFGPINLGGLGSAFLIAIFACQAFEGASIVAGESKNPQRDVPAGILGGIVGVGLIYTLIMIASLRLVPNLAESSRPLADAAAALVGDSGAILMALAAVISCAGTLSASMLSSPRVLFALSNQGDMPKVFAKVGTKSHTPVFAILCSAVLVWVLTTSGTFIYLATFSVIARLLMYGSTCAALMVFRKRDGRAPVTIPFGWFFSTVALVTVLATVTAAGGTALRDVSIAMVVGLILREASHRFGKRAGASAEI